MRRLISLSCLLLCALSVAAPTRRRAVRGQTVFLFYAAAHASKQQLITAALSARQILEPRFPELRHTRVTIHVWPEAAGNLNGDRYNAGRSAERMILIQNCELLLRQNRLLTVLIHELTHIALSRLGPGHLPLWLDEGCALLFSRDTIPPGSPLPGGIRSPTDLSRALRTHSRKGGFSSWKGLRPLYQRALKMTALLKNNQEEHFLHFIRALKKGQPFRIALSRFYALTPRVLWRQSE